MPSSYVTGMQPWLIFFKGASLW